MELILIGSSGYNVRVLQKRLQAAGYEVTVDGDFGSNTDIAVRAFQRDHNLIDDGVVGPKTQAALMGRDTRMLLSNADIARAAELLQVDPAAVNALREVESRGTGFLDDGRVVILYERHIMRRRMLANGFKRAEVVSAGNRFPGLVNKTPGGYRGYYAEHFRLGNASKIHAQSAMESCSWGQFQIMGYHWERLGFESVHAFVTAMRENEANHLQAFVSFIQTDADLLKALQARDWKAFARIYNGPGYKKNRYDTRLAEAYARYQPQEQAA
ncbi:N-acetylmuramidase domain-containing protein [Marinobacterium stanieri]|uniref:Putative peptidoglycan binding domain-containing protein n=1 Tax=Marinobacterium stanieri TaxID=49186 RepID=A0A1N6Q2Q5_9GAMM|nr:N-acetylmuramidase family protein [Marinobacterium stanieri]SIQ10739.1 Putative peptidoglycan binding domain-containing protein [Marinobacterium stanieri]